METSRAFLVRSATLEATAGTLFHEITDEHLKQWRKTWIPAMQIRRANLPEKDWPQDEHWPWNEHVKKLRGILAFQTFALTCDGDLQGMMLTSVLAPARLSQPPGQPMVYVELVSTAPWNRPEIEAPPRFRGVGKVMIKAAIQLSLAEGYKGRIGLHSLSAAEEFYRNKCGMTGLGMDAEKEMVYFEMPAAKAKAFLDSNA